MDIQVTFTWLRKLLGSAMVLDQYASILLSACFLYSIYVLFYVLILNMLPFITKSIWRRCYVQLKYKHHNRNGNDTIYAPVNVKFRRAV